MAVQDMGQHLDRYMVLGCLRGMPANELTGYLRKACYFPLRPLHRDLSSALDELFSELKNQIPKPPLCERVRWAWISDENLAAIDARLTARLEGYQ